MARRRKDDSIFGALNELTRVTRNNKKNNNQIENLFVIIALIIVLLWFMFK